MMPQDEAWDLVRERWKRAVELINGSEDQPVAPVQMKRMFRHSLMSTKVPIYLTGTRGCGKTTLFDALLNQITDGYAPLGKSPRMERRGAVVRAADGGRTRSMMYVIPGQFDLRHGPAKDLFEGGNSPTGVIHVVAWGFGTPWADGAQPIRTELQAQGKNGADAVQAHQQSLELASFRELRARLRQCWRKTQSEIWLIIAVAKCDLFWDQISATERYYLPDYPESDSPFFAELRGLVNDVGRTQLSRPDEIPVSRVAVVPVCMYPETYQFDSGSPKYVSQLGITKSFTSVSNLRSIVGEFCGH